MSLAAIHGWTALYHLNEFDSHTSQILLLAHCQKNWDLQGTETFWKMEKEARSHANSDGENSDDEKFEEF